MRRTSIALALLLSVVPPAGASNRPDGGILGPEQATSARADGDDALFGAVARVADAADPAP